MKSLYELRLMYDPIKIVPKQPPVANTVAKIIKEKNTIHSCEQVFAKHSEGGSCPHGRSSLDTFWLVNRRGYQ